MKTFILLAAMTLFLMGCSGSMDKFGVENGKLTACPGKPNCVSSQASMEKDFIKPLLFNGTQQEAQRKLVGLLEASPRTKIVTLQDDYIHAEVRSKLFRFADDVEFYLPASADNSTIIHVRSAARLGYSDFGVNRKRVEAIRIQLNK